MSINRYLGENFGSLSLIEYAAIQNIVSFNQTAPGQITAAGITFKAGADWTSIYCSEDTMGHRQARVNDDNGQSYSQSVQGFVPGDQPAIEAGLLQLENTRFILRITRPDGVQKIVGTQSEPLYLVLDSNSQNTVPGAAGTAINFSGATVNRALLYS